MEKQEIRERMRRLNRTLDERRRLSAAASIFAAVERLPAFRTARTVALFAALPDEPATGEVLARWAATRRLVLPRVEGDTMQFYEYRPDALAGGAFGILEPRATRLCPPAEIDLAVCPGVAFTAAGRRLGRGRGYYDRYLSQPAFRGYRVGVCYAHQLVDDLPVEPHDVRMDAVITDRRIKN